jgi:hypothetical protein
MPLTLPTYAGFDVLNLNPNRAETVEEVVSRKFVLLDTETGIRRADEHSPAAAPARPFRWTAIGRDAVAELIAWLDERRGRRVPFWLPSFQSDLTLASQLAEDDATAEIKWVRYTQQMFPGSGGRRHLAFYPGVGGEQVSMDFYGVVDADDPGDFILETLDLDPPAVTTYPSATTTISFLKFCRLEEDGVTLKGGFDWTEAVIRFREIPHEAPVPE